jgi:hypothetical protein
MNSTLTILVGAAAAVVLAVIAATSLKPADGSFAGGTDPAPAKRTRSDDTAAVAAPLQTGGRRPDYVAGTDALARDREAWQAMQAAAEPRESPPAVADPAPDAPQDLPAEPPPADDPNQ